MEKTFEKTEDGKLKQVVSKTVVESQTFDPQFLLEQRKTILTQKSAEMARRDNEIAEIDEMLEKCLEFKLVNKTIQENQAVEWSLPSIDEGEVPS